MLNKTTTAVVATMIAMVVATGWYAASLTRFTPFSAGALFNMGALTKLHLIQATDIGSIQYQGDIAEATEFNNGDIDFTGMNVTYYGDGQSAPWTLLADKGTALDHHSQINLLGHVNASQPAANKNPPLLIQTDAAPIFTDSEDVKGSGLITLSQPGTINQMQGVGFVADLQGKWLKLFAQVKGQYAPQ